MFDIAWGEFVVIAVVALIVIGPKELPGVLRAIGQWTTKIRRMAAEFQSQFQEALREAEMADLKKEVDNLNSSAKDFTSQFSDPLNFEESPKWEPRSEAKSEAKSEAASKPDEAPKPADAPRPEPALVAPDGHSAPAAAENPPAAEQAHLPAGPAIERTSLPEATEKQGHEGGVHS